MPYNVRRLLNVCYVLSLCVDGVGRGLVLVRVDNPIDVTTPIAYSGSVSR